MSAMSSDRHQSMYARSGFTNGDARSKGISAGPKEGMVNGYGLTNGKGLVNGEGITNGVGHVNGAGFVNGSGSTNRRAPLRMNQFAVVSHRDFRIGLTIILLVLLTMPVLYVLLKPEEVVREIEIDGDFSDWKKVPKYEDDRATENDDVEIQEYAVYLDSNYLYLYVKVSGIALGDSVDYDALLVFVDSDGSSDTGYRAGSIGAEYLIKIAGGNNTVGSTSVSVFGGTDQHNWSAWRHFSIANAQVAGSEIEAALHLADLELEDDFLLLFHFRDGEGNFSTSSVAIGKEMGALLVTQTPTNETVISGTSEAILYLNFQAFGSDVVIDNVQFVKSENVWLTEEIVTPLTISEGQQVTRAVKVDATRNTAEELLVLGVQSVSADRPVTVVGEEARAYAWQYPSNKTVDGLFDDWMGGEMFDDETVTNPNVDIDRYGSAQENGRAFFYLCVRGESLRGYMVPEPLKRPVRPKPSEAPPGPVVPAKRVSGEDFTRIYIDTQSGDTFGFPIGGIRANRMIEIRGIGGVVTGLEHYVWSGAGWQLATATMTVERAGERLELFINQSDLGELREPLVAFQTTDWRNTGDLSTLVIPLNFSGSRGITRSTSPKNPLHGANGETVDAVDLTSAPTVDGDCSDSAYSDADYVEKTDYDMWVGKHEGFVYVCVMAKSDTTSSLADFAELMFDTRHDGGAAPAADDRKFNVTSGSTLLDAKRGNGSGWVDCGTDCSTSNAAEGAYTDGVETYEFKIAYTDVWGTPTPSHGQVAGFAVRIYDFNGPANYYWGSSEVDRDSPDTWGHMVDFPEFEELLVPVAIVLLVGCISRRRRKH